MSDLISRSELSEEIESLTMVVTGLRSGKSILDTFMKEYKKYVLKIIEEQPTVEAVPVVHGEWVYDKRKDRIYCNCCNNYAHRVWNETSYEISELISDFCPHCGADMRKKV